MEIEEIEKGKTGFNESLNDESTNSVESACEGEETEKESGLRPWYDRDDLIMSNKEYWEELERIVPPSEEELNIDVYGLDPTDEEDFKAIKKSAKLTLKRYMSEAQNKIFERRWMGAKKALFEWEQNGCKGEIPEGIDSIFFATHSLLNIADDD